MKNPSSKQFLNHGVLSPSEPIFKGPRRWSFGNLLMSAPMFLGLVKKHL